MIKKKVKLLFCFLIYLVGLIWSHFFLLDLDFFFLSKKQFKFTLKWDQINFFLIMLLVGVFSNFVDD